jgi:dihydrofolate reductase
MTDMEEIPHTGREADNATHRLKLVDELDRVIVIGKETIIEDSGTFDDLHCSLTQQVCLCEFAASSSGRGSLRRIVHDSPHKVLVELRPPYHTNSFHKLYGLFKECYIYVQTGGHPMIQGLFIVAALGRDRGIGYKNGLLWRIPDDLRRFRRLTIGKAVIMGRKTFESIEAVFGGPLPDRSTIVVTRNSEWKYKQVLVADSLHDAITGAWVCGFTEEIYVCGGAEIYAEALPHAERLYLTLIDAVKPADTFFPPYEHLFTKKVFEEVAVWNGLVYRYIELTR